jgi:APA family basic amino acid/polyamine antiporter
MIVAGSMIGSGIFIVSADISRNVGSAGWLLFVWLITGFMTLTAAVSYGELSGMFPKAGGQYVYLKESYNPLIGFFWLPARGPVRHLACQLGPCVVHATNQP